MNYLKLASIFIILITPLSADGIVQFSKISEDKIHKYLNFCKSNEEYINQIVDSEMTVDCARSFHHYNSSGYKTYYNKANARKSGDLRVGSFNLWHPGKSNTKFKDYKLVAEIINSYDILSGLELLGNLGEDRAINYKIVDKMLSLKRRKSYLRNKLRRSKNIRRQRNKIELELTYINNKLEKLLKIYKVPGYIVILNELRRLDPSWSLVISPYGEAAKRGDVEELTGIFYRSTKLRPFPNRYCKEQVNNGKGLPIGCYPNFSKDLFNGDVNHLFSRRPFMANFESGNFDFTMMASHVVFSSPKNKYRVQEILNKVFNVNNISEIGKGVNKENFARFAEVKMMTILKEALLEYSEKDIIMAGDFNLESNIPFWDKFLDEESLLIDSKTSLSEHIKDSRLNETGGYASNYDHFIINKRYTSECDTRNSLKFDIITDELVHEYMDKYYLVRTNEIINSVLISQKGDANNIIRSATDKLRNRLLDQKSIKNNKIVSRYSEFDIDKILYNFKRRVFGSQFGVDTFYRVYKEVISDHAPIGISCSTDTTDDDQRL